MKSFCFTVDDNIRFLKEICDGEYESIFDHPYTDMLRRLHGECGLKIQLNLFYRYEEFDLSQMTDRYAEQWRENSDWLKLSFHSDRENVRPYENSDYDEVFSDCKAVNGEIVRFATADSLADTTTVHYCLATKQGLRALGDNGVKGLLGLFGDEDNPRSSYGIGEEDAARIRAGEVVCIDGISFASIDMIINSVQIEHIPAKLEKLMTGRAVRVMIHEQYFYEDYSVYQPDFEDKLRLVFEILTRRGYESVFFEETI